MTAEQLTLDFEVKSAHGVDDYLVGEFNQQAYDLVTLWPQWSTLGVVLCGPEGSGKTHLGEIWRSQSKAKDLNLEQLAPETLREYLAPGMAAIVRVADRMGPSQQEVLFHLYNLAKEQGSSLLLIAHHPPARWGVGLKDLESRVRTLPVAQINNPDDGALAALLVKLFSDRQLRVSSQVIHYLVPRMQRSFVMAQRLVQWLDKESLANRREIKLPLAKQALESCG